MIPHKEISRELDDLIAQADYLRNLSQAFKQVGNPLVADQLLSVSFKISSAAEEVRHLISNSIAEDYEAMRARQGNMLEKILGAADVSTTTEN